MLLQLLPAKELYSIMKAYKEMHPKEVLELVTREHGQNLGSATVILVINGLQSFMVDPGDGQKQDSAFYKALTNIADLTLGNIFLMVCCTTTVISPVDKALASTHWKWVILPVTSLEPLYFVQDGRSKLVFNENDHIIKVLVSNCGGHGRALESLQQAIEDAGKSYNIELLMNGLHHGLRDCYSEAISTSSMKIQAMA